MVIQALPHRGAHVGRWLPVALAFVESVTAAYPDMAVVLLCPSHTPEFLIQAMRAGVRDVMPSPAPAQALAALYPYTGQAHVIGVTGAPGTGKSSLVNALARQYRGRLRRANAPSAFTVSCATASAFWNIRRAA